MINNLTIATRKSPLAMWQANYVKDALQAAYPDLQVDIVGLLTEGDKLLASSLAKIGGKGLFVKELEKLLLERRADIAVHSIKDMPVTLPDNLILAAICEREDPRDAFISRHFASIEELPLGATVGTSSSRRSCELKARRADLVIENLRGNVGTRLRKLDEGQYDAIILAAAGLKRLGEADRIRTYLDPQTWIPAVGQGAIGIECHQDNHAVIELLQVLDHPPTRICISAERAMNAALNGGCQLPIAAYATLSGAQLNISGMVGNPQNNSLIKSNLSGSAENAELLGVQLAEKLLNSGAKDILAALILP